MKLHTPSPQRSSYHEAMSLFPSTSQRREPPPLSETTILAIRRLQRIQRLTVYTSGLTNGHRCYVVDVVRQSVRPSTPPSSYQVRFASPALRELRTQLHDRTHESCTSFRCPMCTTLVGMLATDYMEPSRLRTLTELSKKHDGERVEALLSMLLDHAVLSAAANAVHCVGCEWAVQIIAEFLRQPYEPSTGLI